MRLRGQLLLGLAIVAAALAAAVYAAFERDLDKHRRRIAEGSRVIETRCGPIEYAAAGSGPALLVLHGAGGGFDQGMTAAGALAQRGVRVIAPSRFGYLRTPMPKDASAEAQADAHACLLDALGIQRAAVLGASAGALSALQFALRHPQRTAALVLLVPAVYYPQRRETPPLSPFAERVLEAIIGADFPLWLTTRLAPDLAIKLVLATPPEEFHRAPPAEQARASELLENLLPLSARAAGLRNDAKLASAPPRYALERIAAPTLIFGVRDDRFGLAAAAAYTASQIPGARLIEFERGGHLWLGHHPRVLEETAALVLAAR
jgi:pimeloyl-ACP methyl ester carboxylesterase